MAAIEALKAITTFGNAKDFEDQEALEDLANNFRDFVTSGDPEVQTLLPKLVSKISEVLKDFENNGENTEPNLQNQNTAQQESYDMFDMNKWMIETAGRFVVD